MAHTPGPWQAEAPPAEAYLDPDIALSEEVRFWIVDEGRASEVLAEVTLTMHGNAEANARVMAAAPDMLAALKLIVWHFGDPLKVARAAILKAEGQS